MKPKAPSRAFTRDQPVFSRKLPVTEKSPANAVVRRYLGEVQGQTVVEIEHASAKWLVKESELLDIDAALGERAKELNALIELLKQRYPRKPDLLNALGICESVFRRWNRIITNHLPNKEKTT